MMTTGREVRKTAPQYIQKKLQLGQQEIYYDESGKGS